MPNERDTTAARSECRSRRFELHDAGVAPRFALKPREVDQHPDDADCKERESRVHPPGPIANVHLMTARGQCDDELLA